MTTRPDGVTTDAAHLVPSRGPGGNRGAAARARGPELRRIIFEAEAELGLEPFELLNGSGNGLMLPRRRADALPRPGLPNGLYHGLTHTDHFYSTLLADLGRARRLGGAAAVQTALQNIRRQIWRGTYRGLRRP